MDSPNQLRIGFGPDTLQFDVDVNGPGDVLSLDRATLQAELSASELLPYGEVLEGVLTGDPLLSVRADTAEDCWRILEPVLKAWAAGQRPAGGVRRRDPGPGGLAGVGTGPRRSRRHRRRSRHAKAGRAPFRCPARFAVVTAVGLAVG